MQRRDQRTRVTTAIAIAMLSVCLGCRGQRAFQPRGSIAQQQAQAIINDPFPQNDIAPYEATLRPPGFERPLPEPVRNRIYNDAVNGFNQ